MRISEIIRRISSRFEKFRKNPIQLGSDSNLDNNLKPLKVADKSTPINISEDTVNVNGSLKVNGEAVQTGSEVGAIELNDLSDVTYSSGDLTISSLDKINTDGDIELDAGGDITLDAGGNDVIITTSAGVQGFNFNTASGLKVFNLLDTDDYVLIDCDVNGHTTITTQDSDDQDYAHLSLDIEGTIFLNSNSGKFRMEKAGTEFSPTDSAYAGMILGYTDIGLNETHANVALTTSFAVPTDEHSVTFTAPPSGNVEIWCQFGQMYLGSSGAGDLYAGLSTANATDGYSALASYHEEGINNGNIRYGFFTPSNSWTLTGLTAGTSYTYWVGVKSSSTTGPPRLYWGGNSTLRYPDFIVKAIALPATIST